jgi:hypothetical protein
MPRDLKSILEDIDDQARLGLYLIDGEMDQMTVRSVELSHWIGLIDLLLEYRAGHEPDPECEAALRTYRSGLAVERTRLSAIREEAFAAKLPELRAMAAANQEAPTALKALRSAISRWRFKHPDPERHSKAFKDDDCEPVELTEVQKQQVHNMTADIPDDDPDRNWLVNFAELMVTARRDDEGMEALKADIAREQANLQRNPNEEGGKHMEDEISYAEPSLREVHRWAFRTLHVLYALGLRSGEFIREDAWDALRRLAGGEPTTPQEMRAALAAIGDAEQSFAELLPPRFDIEKVADALIPFGPEN